MKSPTRRILAVPSLLFPLMLTLTACQFIPGQTARQGPIRADVRPAFSTKAEPGQPEMLAFPNQVTPQTFATINKPDAKGKFWWVRFAVAKEAFPTPAKTEISGDDEDDDQDERSEERSEDAEHDSNPAPHRIWIPENGDFKINLVVGSRFQVIDSDARDHEATIQFGSQEQLLAGFLELQGPKSRESKKNKPAIERKLTIAESLYNVNQTVTRIGPEGNGRGKEDKNDKKQSWLKLGKRPFPLPASWGSSDGQKYVLNFTNQGVQRFVTRWYRAQTGAQPDYPVGINEIGPAGGTLELPGISKLEIPPGALSTKTVVKMVQEAQVPAISSFGHGGVFIPNASFYAGPVITLYPTKLQLSQPAKLSINHYATMVARSCRQGLAWVRLQTKHSPDEWEWDTARPFLVGPPAIPHEGGLIPCDTRFDQEYLKIPEFNTYTILVDRLEGPKDRQQYFDLAPSFRTQQQSSGSALQRYGLSGPFMAVFDPADFPGFSSQAYPQIDQLIIYMNTAYDVYKQRFTDSKPPQRWLPEYPGALAGSSLNYIPLYLFTDPENPHATDVMSGQGNGAVRITLPVQFHQGPLEAQRKELNHELWHGFQLSEATEKEQKAFSSQADFDNLWIHEGTPDLAAAFAGEEIKSLDGFPYPRGNVSELQARIDVNQQILAVPFNLVSLQYTKQYAAGSFFGFLADEISPAVLLPLLAKHALAEFRQDPKNYSIRAVNKTLTEAGSSDDFVKSFGDYARATYSKQGFFLPPVQDVPLKSSQSLGTGNNVSNPLHVQSTTALPCLAIEHHRITDLHGKSNLVVSGSSNPNLTYFLNFLDANLSIQGSSFPFAGGDLALLPQPNHSAYGLLVTVVNTNTNCSSTTAPPFTPDDYNLNVYLNAIQKPSLHSVLPSTVNYGSSQVMTVTGTGLTDIDHVVVNGVFRPLVGVPTDTTLQFQWPKTVGIAGGDFNVIAVSTSGASTNPLPVHVIPECAPGAQPSIDFVSDRTRETALLSVDFTFCAGASTFDYFMVFNSNGHVDRKGLIPNLTLTAYPNHQFGAYQSVPNYPEIYFGPFGVPVPGSGSVYIEIVNQSDPTDIRRSGSSAFTIDPY